MKCTAILPLFTFLAAVQPAHAWDAPSGIITPNGTDACISEKLAAVVVTRGHNPNEYYVVFTRDEITPVIKACEDGRRQASGIFHQRGIGGASLQQTNGRGPIRILTGIKAP